MCMCLFMYVYPMCAVPVDPLELVLQTLGSLRVTMGIEPETLGRAVSAHNHSLSIPNVPHAVKNILYYNLG